MPTIHSIALWPTVTVVIVATITDLRTGRIPNWLVLPFLVLGLLVSAVDRGWGGLGQSLLGVLEAAAVMGAVSYLGGMGMGDVKLCAAIGAWIGPSQLVGALVMTGLAGGVIALGYALAGGFLKESLRGTRDIVWGFRKRGFRPHETLMLDNPLTRKMPYAPAIAIGTICSFLGGN